MKYVQMIFSPTGGTSKVANIITQQWSSTVETIDLSNPEDDFSKYTFQEDDVVLIALPSYGGRVPGIAAERIKCMQGNHARCVLVCVYGNRDYEDTLVEMEDIAKQCGFSTIAAISAVAEHSIMHQYATGRPDVPDIKKLKSYAKSIMTKLQTAQQVNELKLPGNRPYKKVSAVGLVPKANKNCVNCGLCATKCPVSAINKENLKTADKDKCISCMRCVNNCPYSARKVNGAMVSIASLAIKKACTVRKECELFI
ncbi:MAG: EFR1 family ferrodoxin [Intestinibacter bartlettii]|uniref:EFR1 family ferrodoxin n=1 Tax=Intestinibacter bartlettii TaxID=261299 RepID=UPI0026ED51CF|nr:EFR1 family ferrodoxin [Intestinibacter bartlettii]MDO5010802.1 EFR1 family ferrodoxin [Intestinibacter bartlettii]